MDQEAPQIILTQGVELEEVTDKAVSIGDIVTVSLSDDGIQELMNLRVYTNVVDKTLLKQVTPNIPDPIIGVTDIRSDSPVALLLLGKNINDTFQFQIRTTTTNYKVLRIQRIKPI